MFFNRWQALEALLGKNPAIHKNSSVHEFLCRNEWQHLHLSSIFVPQQHEDARVQNQFSQKASKEQVKKTLVYQEEGVVQAMLMWTKHQRLLFDCLALRGQRAGDIPYLLKQEIKSLLRKYPPQQFIGTKMHYDFLKQHLNFEERLYLMMVRKSVQKSVQAEKHRMYHGLHFERLDSSHFEQLLPLEFAYYAEEVLLAPLDRQMKRILQQECARRLKQYLQYGIFMSRELLARIMINAYGLYYWQIGGIYTAPRWRGQGLATYLLHKMCGAIEASGRRAMLFVREQNPIAQSLYTRNGFKTLDQMIIAQKRL